MERIILTTGGTGGHIFPALAVAQEIRRRYPAAMILFMGGRYGQEADLAAQAGVDFVGLPVRGVMGRGIKGVGAMFAMADGIFKAVGIMRKTKPQVVIGFGGYAAFAGVMAAHLSGIPTAIHEQNAFPGMANRILGKMVDKVFLSMPQPRSTQPVFAVNKTTVVGNPVRSGIVALYKKRMEQHSMACGTISSGTSFYGGVDGPSPFGVHTANREQSGARERSPVDNAAKDTQMRHPRLLVMGGSLGAKAINDGMIAAIGSLLEAGIEIRHQTGQADYERVRAAYRSANAEHVRVQPFIEDMTKAYEWSDLVFCRAGASSLAEITAAGLPSVLVPFPQAAQDHQRFNARYLEEEGAAIVLEQDRFLSNPRVLSETLIPLLRDTKRLELMAGNSLASALPHASARLVDGLESLLSVKKH